MASLQQWNPNPTILVMAVMSLLFHCSSAQVHANATNSCCSQTRQSIGQWEEEIGVLQSIALIDSTPLFTKHSAFQKIEVHKSKYYGKILVLDDVVQMTERDADSYNEMMAHMPLFQHRNPRRVLIIGGGDGYVLSEVLKHASVEHVDHVDLDEEVIATCREHFAWGAAWNDPRVHLHIRDGAAFAAQSPPSNYDVIIQDSSDPWSWDDLGSVQLLPSSVLYAESHFAQIHRILTPGGIFNLQAEAFSIPADLVGLVLWRKQAIRVGFQSARYGSLFISSYPTGQIGFLLCEKNTTDASDVEAIERRFAKMVDSGASTSYYHPPLQHSSFVLPLWVHRKVYEDEREGTVRMPLLNISSESPTCLG